MTLAAFNASAQQAFNPKFKETIAAAAGMASGDSGRVALTVTLRGGEQRLLASSVAVDVTIDMPDSAAVRLAATSLTTEQTRINAGLAAAGLSSVYVTVTSLVSESAGLKRLQWAGKRWRGLGPRWQPRPLLVRLR